MTTQTHDGWVIPEFDLSDRLRRIRRDTGLTQAAFAQRLGVGDKAYGSWETGTLPNDIVSIAKRIELAFRVPAAWVLGISTGGPGPMGDPSGPNGGALLTQPYPVQVAA